MGYNPWGSKESDMTERLTLQSDMRCAVSMRKIM